MNPNVWRADHIGSFLRPTALLQARQDRIEPTELKKLEDLCIGQVLESQKEAGAAIFTDGEFRRSNFMSDFTDAVSGFDLDDAVTRPWEAAQGSAPVSRVAGIVTSKLEKRRALTMHEFEFLKQNAPGPIKLTMPSVTQFTAMAFNRADTDK